MSNGNSFSTDEPIPDTPAEKCKPPLLSALPDRMLRRGGLFLGAVAAIGVLAVPAVYVHAGQPHPQAACSNCQVYVHA